MNTNFPRKRHLGRRGIIGKARPGPEPSSPRVRNDPVPKHAEVFNNTSRCFTPAKSANNALEPDSLPARMAEAPRLDVSGILEILPNSDGFLRNPANNYKPSAGDAFVPRAIAQQFGLRPGVMVRGLARQSCHEHSPFVHELLEVEGCLPAEYQQTRQFNSQTPIHPQVRLSLETGPLPLSTRIIDLFAPVGKGQRALIIAPPRTGKTVLLKEIGQALAANYPQVKLVVLLVDERPEEVTDMRRNVAGEILASNLDQDAECHVRLSQLVVDRCKRLAESGQDVVLLIDSLTRMARAFNKSVRSSGKTLSGGLDVKALDIPKKLFAAARAFEEGGSLTILATVLVETGSRMDDLIYEEFRGTGNLELLLDRRLAERRIWPAIDLTKSGTRREEKLLDVGTQQAVTYRRRNWNPRDPSEIMQDSVMQLGRYRSNLEFVEFVSRQMGKMTAA